MDTSQNPGSGEVSVVRWSGRWRHLTVAASKYRSTFPQGWGWVHRATAKSSSGAPCTHHQGFPAQELECKFLFSNRPHKPSHVPGSSTVQGTVCGIWGLLEGGAHTGSHLPSDALNCCPLSLPGDYWLPSLPQPLKLDPATEPASPGRGYANWTKCQTLLTLKALDFVRLLRERVFIRTQVSSKLFL